MIKVFIVDDEPLALRNMEKMLRQFPDITIAGKFQNPCEAISAAKQQKVDIVFLDIEMPVMNGLEAAEHFQRVDASMNIVFTTAYNHYAVEAFELHALDYIMKPIRRERLEKTLQRVSETKVQLHDTAKEPTLIRMFRSLQYEQSKALESFQWRTQKSQELFAYLLHKRQHKTRRDMLIDILWPDSEPNKAFANLYTVVYQLRRTLQRMNLGINIVSSEEGYYLEIEEETIHIDVDEWEQFIISDPAFTMQTLPQHREMMALYRGDYLADHDYRWAENRRQQLGMQWLIHAMKMTDFLVAEQLYPEAITLCDEMQQRFPYNGHSYYVLMQIFAILGDRSKVEEQYDTLTALLAEELDETPEAHITDWYLTWKT